MINQNKHPVDFDLTEYRDKCCATLKNPHPKKLCLLQKIKIFYCATKKGSQSSMATTTFLFSEIPIFHLVIVVVGCAFYLHIDKITRSTCLFCLNVCKMKKNTTLWILHYSSNVLDSSLRIYSSHLNIC